MYNKVYLRLRAGFWLLPLLIVMLSLLFQLIYDPIVNPYLTRHLGFEEMLDENHRIRNIIESFFCLAVFVVMLVWAYRVRVCLPFERREALGFKFTWSGVEGYSFDVVTTAAQERVVAWLWDGLTALMGCFAVLFVMTIWEQMAASLIACSLLFFLLWGSVYRRRAILIAVFLIMAMALWFVIAPDAFHNIGATLWGQLMHFPWAEDRGAWK